MIEKRAHRAEEDKARRYGQTADRFDAEAIECSENITVATIKRVQAETIRTALAEAVEAAGVK